MFLPRRMAVRGLRRHGSVWRRVGLLLLGLVLGVAACGRAGPRGTPFVVSPTAHIRPPSRRALLSPTPGLLRARSTPTLVATRRPSPTPTRATRPIRLLFTGNIVPARCVQAALDAGEITADDLYAEVAPWIQAADLAVGTLNAALSDYPPMRGCVKTFVLVGRSLHAAALARAGFDGLSVATNHIKNCGLLDCGDRAFLDTLQALHAAGLWTVGAGENLDAALEPVVVEVQGVRFALVSLGKIEPRAFAGPDSPGIAPLTPSNLRIAMERARAQRPDVIIALPHWGPEYEPTPNVWQRDLARQFVEEGATVVVGNHSHVVQGMEIIQGVPVFYSLGNFLFDQDWSRETQQGVMLVLHFQGARLVGWQFIPTVTEGNGVVHLATAEDAAATLARIWAASPRDLPPTPTLTEPFGP